MFETGYYPPGAEHDPSAPYNEVEPETYKAKYDIYATLSKTKVEIEMTHFSDCDPEEQYSKQHYTIVEMLKDYIELLKKEINNLEAKKDSFTPSIYQMKVKPLMQKIADASGWSEEFEFD